MDYIKQENFEVDGENLSLTLENVPFPMPENCFTYLISVKNSKGVVVGECCYGLSNKEKDCYLIYIEIFISDYIKKGIGHKMIKFMEEDAKNNDCKLIRGVFSPYGASAKNTKDFYVRNKYQIKKDGKQKLTYFYKNLNADENEISLE